MKKLITKINKAPTDKKLLIFDLDGTLTKSKSPMDKEMSGLLKRLLAKDRVVVIGGGRYKKFQDQLLTCINAPASLLKNLFLFPANATLFYVYKNRKWHRQYSLKLSLRDRRRIANGFRSVLRQIGYKHPKKTYGVVIEDRETEVTFSALGQKAPLRLKEKWKKENTSLKLKIAKTLQKFLPDMEVRSAGFTSIDVTRKGIDKEYGIKQIKNRLHVPIKNMLFVGDALFPGGNDFAARNSGVICVSVKSPEETKILIRRILAR